LETVKGNVTTMDECIVNLDFTIKNMDSCTEFKP